MESDVSVVVPSHNHSRFVEATLRSIFRQQIQPLKLLVIDDGSTDGSPAVIERVLRDCPFPAEFIRRSNRGLCATLNEGLTKTQGKYFAYLGSDDLWVPEFLSARLSMMEGRPEAVVGYGHAFLIDGASNITDCTADWAHYIDGNARTMLLKEAIAPMSPTVVYRRSAVERHGWNEKSRLEDYELYLRLSRDGPFAFDPRVLSAWRQHGTNTSRDSLWMIKARLDAQRAVANELGLSKNELVEYERSVKLAGAEDLLRLGQKKKGLALLREGWRGGSNWARGRTLLRLLTPYSLVKWRAQKKTRAAGRFGHLPE